MVQGMGCSKDTWKEQWDKEVCIFFVLGLFFFFKKKEIRQSTL